VFIGLSLELSRNLFSIVTPTAFRILLREPFLRIIGSDLAMTASPLKVTFLDSGFAVTVCEPLVQYSPTPSISQFCFNLFAVLGTSFAGQRQSLFNRIAGTSLQNIESKRRRFESDIGFPQDSPISVSSMSPAVTNRVVRTGVRGLTKG